MSFASLQFLPQSGSAKYCTKCMRKPARLAAIAAVAFAKSRPRIAQNYHTLTTDLSRGQGFLVHQVLQRDSGSSSLLMISPSFRRLQLRSCVGRQDGEENREESLEKLRGLVDGWVLEGEAEDVEDYVDQRLASSSGLLDDWNLEDWREFKVEPLRDVTRTLLQGFSERFAGQEVATVKSDSRKAREKKVIGMDKDLPSRVLVEFSEATTLTELTSSDVNKLFILSKEDEHRYFSEGLPNSFIKEFHISSTNALLIRSQFLTLVNHLTKVTEKNSTNDEHADAEPDKKEVALIEPLGYMSLNQRKKLARERRLLDKADLGLRKQIVLDGLPGSGKSVVLAMLVQWARSKGWLVCYIPSGRKWTHNGLYYKNELSGLWDTPVQATSMLQDLLKSHNDILSLIPCRIFDPIPLGEGPGIGCLSGSQEAPLQENCTLKDLVQLGIDSPHAAVGVVVRLRKEFSLVVEVPVLIAVDQFNSWFTFSGFYESFNDFGRRQIHARELIMVQAFRDMTSGPIIVGAFSHSTNVGKLPKQLPGVPFEAKVFLNRYDFLEASVMLKHYIRKWCGKAKFGKRARRALYMLTNGNAIELRDIALLTAGGLRQAVPEAAGA